MRSKKGILRALSVFIFVLGVLVGMALAAGMIWGDLEASMFDSAFSGEAAFKTLNCPVMVTTREIGTVSADLMNPLEKPVNFMTRAQISEGYVSMIREINTRLPLDPGETQTLEWAVSSDDAVYGGRLILFRMRVLPKYPIPTRHASCGILVLDLPYLSGQQFFVLTLAASVLNMAGGLGLWYVARRPLRAAGRRTLYAMGVLAGCVLAVMLAGFLGHWFLGVFMFVSTLLLIGVMIGYFLKVSPIL